MPADQLDRLLRAIAFQALILKDHRRLLRPYQRDFTREAGRDAETIRAASRARLLALLRHAGASSPYYRELFAARGFDPRKPSAVNNLQRLPLVTKELLARHKEGMRSRRYRPEHLVTSFTGGSSGTPTGFFQDPACSLQRLGRQWGILDRCGYRLGQRCGLIWGVHADLPDPSRPPGLKARLRQFATARESLCCTVMRRADLLDFHRRLQRFRPHVLYGYPNAMEEFALFIRSEGLAPLRVATVICTAERLTGRQRALFSQQFSAEVYNLYCTREHGCIGFECREHNGLHIDAGSVYIEILEKGRPVPPGQTGDIVVTDLLNYGMPFIRSRIGDRGSLSPTPCSCGCALPLLQAFEGRVTDTLYRADGSSVAGLMLVDMFLDDPLIENLQVIQNRVGDVELLLEVRGPFGATDEQRVRDETRHYMGDGTAIQIRLVPEIPRNPRSGKFQEVICRVTDRPLPA
jgi:phenylacetate-CoA ligase